MVSNLSTEEIEMLFLSEIETTPISDLTAKFIPNWLKKHQIPKTVGNLMLVGKLYTQYMLGNLGEMFKL